MPGGDAIHECPAHDGDRHHGCRLFDHDVGSCWDHDCRHHDDDRNAPARPHDRAAAYDDGGPYRALVDDACDDLAAAIDYLHANHDKPWWW